MATTDPGITAIRIIRGDTTFHVHGELAGSEGVYLSAKQVHGLYDAPVKPTYRTGAFQEGSTHRYTKKLHRDLELGFLIKEASNSYEFNDSQFRQLFQYEVDRWDPDETQTTIEVETELSGTRKLDVLMYEQPEFVPDLDPLMQEFGNVIFKLRAPDPMWYEDTVTAEGASTVTVSNPTDNICYHKWVVGVGTFTLPDYSWEGPPGDRAPGGTDVARTITFEITSANGGAVIDLDRNELMWRDANDTNIQAQLGGTKFFLHPIPPYTPATDLPVSGGTVQIRMPRRWSRPWGLEQAYSSL